MAKRRTVVAEPGQIVDVTPRTVVPGAAVEAPPEALPAQGPATPAAPAAMALATRPAERGGAMVRPVVSTDEAKAAFGQYRELEEAILTPDDYSYFVKWTEWWQGDNGRPRRSAKSQTFMRAEHAEACAAELRQKERDTNGEVCEVYIEKRKKKSAFRKMGTFFNVSAAGLDDDGAHPIPAVVVETVGPFIVQRKTAPGFTETIYMAAKDLSIIKAEVSVLVVAPNGRALWQSGSASLDEKRSGKDGFTHPSHDIPALAMTRALSRGISDLIGWGETAAEDEAPADAPEDGEQAEAPAPRPPAPRSVVVGAKAEAPAPPPVKAKAKAPAAPAAAAPPPPAATPPAPVATRRLENCGPHCDVPDDPKSRPVHCVKCHAGTCAKGGRVVAAAVNAAVAAPRGPSVPPPAAAPPAPTAGKDRQALMSEVAGIVMSPGSPSEALTNLETWRRDRRGDVAALPENERLMFVGDVRGAFRAALTARARAFKNVSEATNSCRKHEESIKFAAGGGPPGQAWHAKFSAAVDALAAPPAPPADDEAPPPTDDDGPRQDADEVVPARAAAKKPQTGFPF